MPKEIDWAALLENGGEQPVQTVETYQFDELTDTDLDQSISISNTSSRKVLSRPGSRPGSSRSQDTLSPQIANLHSFGDLTDSEEVELRPCISPSLKKTGSLTRKKSNVSFSEPEVEYQDFDLEDELDNMRIFSLADLDKFEIEEKVDSVDEISEVHNVFSIGDISSESIVTEEARPPSATWKEVVKDRVLTHTPSIPVFMVPKPKKVYKDEDTLTHGKSYSSFSTVKTSRSKNDRKRSKSEQSDSTIKTARSSASSRTAKSRPTSKTEKDSYSSYNSSSRRTTRKTSTQDETDISYTESFTSDVTISAVSEEKKVKSKRSRKKVPSTESTPDHSMKTIQPPVCHCQKPRVDINLTDYPLPLAGNISYNSSKLCSVILIVLRFERIKTSLH